MSAKKAVTTKETSGLKRITRVELKGYKPPVLDDKVVGDLVRFGSSNQYPQNTIRLYKHSPVHSAVCRFKAKLVAGLGWDLQGADEEWVKNLGDGLTLDRILKRLALDLVLHNGYALQVSWSTGSDVAGVKKKVVRIKFEDFSTVRKKVNEKGDLLGYYLSKKWKSTLKATKAENYKELPPFDPSKKDEEPNQLYYYEGPNPGGMFYAEPEYSSSFTNIEIDIEFSKFHIHNILNGLLPSMIIEVKGAQPSEEEKDDFDRDVEKKLKGSAGARHLVAYTDGKESGVVIHTVDNKNNEGRYILIHRQTIQQIISGHMLSSPTLAGIAGSGTLGGNGNEIENAYRLFDSIVVVDLQDQAIEGLQDIFTRGGAEEVTVGIKKRNPFGDSSTTETQGGEDD